MMGSRARYLLTVVVPPVATFAAVVLLWHLAVIVFQLKPFQVPSPAAVWRVTLEKFPELRAATLLTASAALTGFAVSLVTGCLVAFLFSQSKIIQRAGYPYAIFLQTVPIIAIAPLIIIWFGHEFRSIVIVSAIISLFPIITTMTTGLTELDRNAEELFELNNATRLQKLLKLRLPGAVPYLIAGAKTSSGLAVIGAIVGEFFAGYGRGKFGLGYLIVLGNSQMKIDYMFAATIFSTMLGLAIFIMVNFIGNRLLLRWRTN